jgi:hypothetical protein
MKIILQMDYQFLEMLLQFMEMYLNLRMQNQLILEMLNQFLEMNFCKINFAFAKIKNAFPKSWK